MPESKGPSWQRIPNQRPLSVAYRTIHHISVRVAGRAGQVPFVNPHLRVIVRQSRLGGEAGFEALVPWRHVSPRFELWAGKSLVTLRSEFAGMPFSEESSAITRLAQHLSDRDLLRRQRISSRPRCTITIRRASRHAGGPGWRANGAASVEASQS